jgi:hypothetical protein
MILYFLSIRGSHAAYSWLGRKCHDANKRHVELWHGGSILHSICIWRILTSFGVKDSAGCDINYNSRSVGKLDQTGVPASACDSLLSRHAEAQIELWGHLFDHNKRIFVLPTSTLSRHSVLFIFFQTVPHQQNVKNYASLCHFATWIIYRSLRTTSLSFPGSSNFRRHRICFHLSLPASPHPRH